MFIQCYIVVCGDIYALTRCLLQMHILTMLILIAEIYVWCYLVFYLQFESVVLSNLSLVGPFELV